MTDAPGTSRILTLVFTDLAGSTARKTARGEIDGEAFDVAIGAALLAHLTHVQAGAHTGQIGLVGVRLLEAQCEEDRGARRVEGEEAAVAGPTDDAPSALGRQPAYVRPMAGDQLADGVVAARGLERRRARQVGEDQRQDARGASSVSH